MYVYMIGAGVGSVAEAVGGTCATLYIHIPERVTQATITGLG